MMNRRFLLTATAVVAAGVLTAAPGTAQDYPAREIRIINNFTPGSANDVFVRFYAERLNLVTRQNVKVENRTKNNGTEATQIAARAKPDGYTILLTPANATLAAASHMYKKLKWDPLQDFAPVTTIAKSAKVVLVNPKTPIKTLAELTTYEKSRKDDASFGANSETSLAAAALYNKLAGIDAAKITATAPQQLMNDLIGGDADFVVMDLPAAVDFVKAGKLRAIAVTGATRSSAVPDVPTMEEAGLKGYGSVEQWWAVFAPSKTPQPILDKLEATFNRIVESEESKKFLSNVRAESFPGDAKAAQSLLSAEVKRWAELVKLADIASK
jgi:tripartite-type tricarboxylate transporter receptor subunit TctC